MKNILVMAGTGIGLFVATAVGLLGMQGRLNYEGTRGIPLLANFFAEPESIPGEGVEVQGGEQKSEEKPVVDLLSNNDGLEVVHEKVSIDGTEPGAESENGSAHGEGQASTAVVDQHQEKRLIERARESLEPSPREEWMMQNKAARGESGVFFSFPKMESSLTVDEINEIYRHAKLSEEEVQRRIKELDERELRLSQRERDVQDRASALSDRILEIQRMETDLQDKVKDFQSKVLLVTRSQEQDLKPFADRLAALDPSKAAEIVRAYWETEAGRLKISMALKIMDRDVANTILSDMEVQEIKDILDSLLKVHRESEGEK